MTGPYRPEDVPELAPALDAMHRGTKLLHLARAGGFTAVCARGHTLLVAIPAAGSHVLLSPVWLARIGSDPFRHELAEGRIVIEGDLGTDTETMRAGAMLADAPTCWWVRCPCSTYGVETAYVVEELKRGTRRAVVAPSFP